MERFLKDKKILKDLGIFLLFLIISLIAFYPTLKSDPLWDDWNFLFQSWTLKNVSAWDFWIWGDYRRSWPLFYTVISYMLKVFKEDLIYFRIVNILLHSANTALIYQFIKKISGKNAFLLALIYLIHPANFFSVAWIIQLKTLMAIFFFMLSLDFFWRFDKLSKKSDYWLSVIFWLFSLLSKSIFSPVILLMPFYRNKKAVIPFIFIGVYSIGLTLWSSHLKDYISEKQILSSTISNQTVFTPNQLGDLNGSKRASPLPKTEYKNPFRSFNLAMKNFSRYTSFFIFPKEVLLVQPPTKVNNSIRELAGAIAICFLTYFAFIYFIKRHDWIALSALSSYYLMLFPLCGIVYIPIFHFSNFVEYWLTAPMIGVIIAVSRVQVKYEKMLSYFLTFFMLILFTHLINISSAYSTSEKIVLKSIEKSPKNTLVKLILAKHYFFINEHTKSNAILNNVKKENGIDKIIIENEIEKNNKALNGEKIDKTSL